METESDGRIPGKKKTSKRRKEEDILSDGSEEEVDKYAPYRKHDHIRVYPHNAQGTSFIVYLESTKPDERFGNKSPIYLNNIFSRFIKGVKQLKRVNAAKYGVIFDNAKNANGLLSNSHFLKSHDLKAYIPASNAECIGVIKFVPTELSNKTLFNKLVSSQEILGIRRFTKKTTDGIIPLKTVSVTFAGNILPDYVVYELCALRVEPYIRPVLQCYKCMNFGHTSKFCKKTTICSICGGDHSFKDCDSTENPICVNCKGDHIAISNMCPIKKRKLEENRQRIFSKITVTSQFPQINRPTLNKSFNNVVTQSTNKKQKIVDNKDLIIEFVNNDTILNAFVKVFTILYRKDNDLPINSQTIKELLIDNVK
jgi:hypothetical protein